MSQILSSELSKDGFSNLGILGQKSIMISKKDRITRYGLKYLKKKQPQFEMQRVMEMHLQFDRDTSYNSPFLPNSAEIYLEKVKWVGKVKMNAFKE